MKCIPMTRHVLAAIGAVLVLGLAMGWMAPANTVEAGPKAYSLPPVYSYSFGASQGGTWFATMHKTGEVNTDQISFNFTKATTVLNLGPGHGTWKYNATKNKVTITTVHTDLDGSGKYFKIVQTTTPDNEGTLTGSVKIYQYASIGAPEPETWYQALCTNEAIIAANHT